MVVLGLLLLLASGALAVGVALDNPETVSATAFGLSLTDVSLGGVFLVGVATGAIGLLGLSMLLGGTRRARTRRSEVRSRRRELEKENAELRARLDGEPYPDETRGAHERTGLFHRS